MEAPPCFNPAPARRIHGWEDWNAYNRAQLERQRPVRPLCLDVIAKAGPGEGRIAWDVGAGAGIESRELRRAGWQVHAVELEAESASLISSHHSGDAPPICVHPGHLATVLSGDADGTPPSLTGTYDLMYAGYSLPYLGSVDFPDVWDQLLSRANPGAWIAVDLFGDRDSFASKADIVCLERADVEALFTDLTVVRFVEEDEDSESWSGPKHWHVFTVVARKEAS